MKTLFITILLILSLNTTLLTGVNIKQYIAPIKRISIVKMHKTTLKIDSTYLHTKYVYGGTTKNGFDCSGLIQKIYKDNNIEIPRNSLSQSQIGKVISIDSVISGDLLFFSGRSIKHSHSTKDIGHVSMYLGNRKIIHSTGRGVVIDSIGGTVWNAYWKQRLIVIKRIM